MKDEDLKPQLATLVSSPPEGAEWVHEAKFDGYRTLAVKKGSRVKFITRNGHDWTKKYAQLAEELKKAPEEEFILDGEVVALNEKGIPDFNKLQNTLDKTTVKRKASGLVFYAFDLLSLNGEPLTRKTLKERKKKLKALFNKKFSDYFLYSEHFESEDVKEIFSEMCKMGLEGLVSKNVNSFYYPGRNENWLKSKCVKADEFIILGYLKGTHHPLGSLLLGSYEGEQLKFSGKVGTGFSKKKKDELIETFKSLETKNSPIKEKLEYGKIVWLKPQLVAEINYLERTSDNHIRHGSFQRLREDKDPQEVILHKRPPTEKSSLVYPALGIDRERELLYYKNISPIMIKYVQNRPLNVYICHGGIGGNCYFYRRSEKNNIEHVEMTLKPNGHFIMSVEDFRGMESLIQLGTVEFHTWGCLLQKMENPDMIVMDLDASPEVPLEEIRLCAKRLKDLFSELGLKTFIKTSGGKGYHIHVPLLPIYTWDQIKNFTESISKKMEEDFPHLYTTSMSRQKRKGKIFIDFLRNVRGSTAVAPYSLRARENAPIAVPIFWKELDSIAPDYFTLSNSHLLLQRKDPWSTMYKLKQRVRLLDAL